MNPNYNFYIFTAKKQQIVITISKDVTYQIKTKIKCIQSKNKFFSLGAQENILDFCSVHTFANNIKDAHGLQIF